MEWAEFVIPLARFTSRQLISRMPDPLRKLVVVGDRVLITPQEGEERTKVGLYLPSTAVDQDAFLVLESMRAMVPSPAATMPRPATRSD